jgi:alkanesulfonate monooxygenase SsuD/methylene tetrahydromethanopterin reductase-like flavin-dependent oxidoreductase (luciferase family)
MTDEQADQLLAAGAAAHVDEMLTYTALGTPDHVQDYLDGFLRRTEADELMVTHQAPTIEGRLQSVVLLGEAMLNVSTT